jgi:excisionase family DNA binding protein
MSGITQEPVGPNRVARRKKGTPSRKSAVATEPASGTLALTVNEAAYVLRVSPNTIWNLLADGRLSGFAVGRRRLIALSEIEDFIAAGGTESPDGSS